MKKQAKIALVVLAAATMMVTFAKAKPATGTALTSVATIQQHSVVDSLGITDPDEKKVFNLYDEAVTIYINWMREAIANPSKAKTAEYAEEAKKFGAEAKRMEPEINRMKAKWKNNTDEIMKYQRFAMYESQRMMVVMSKYQQIKMH